jgi:hypothetical protein
MGNCPAWNSESSPAGRRVEGAETRTRPPGTNFCSLICLVIQPASQGLGGMKLRQVSASGIITGHLLLHVKNPVELNRERLLIMVSISWQKDSTRGKGGDEWISAAHDTLFFSYFFVQGFRIFSASSLGMLRKHPFFQSSFVIVGSINHFLSWEIHLQ